MSEASSTPLAPEPPKPELTRAERTINWIKRNPIYVIGAALVPVIGFVSGAPKAWDSISAVLNLPTCLTYSDVYYYYNGHFKRFGQKWTEFQPSIKYAFEEIFRDRNYIIILNKTPRDNPRWGSMLVRLPVCGGTAQWTYEILSNGQTFFKSSEIFLLSGFRNRRDLNNRITNKPSLR